MFVVIQTAENYTINGSKLILLFTSKAFQEALQIQLLKKELFPARFWGMSHFVKSSKGELMFAALALPRGWKSRLEPYRFQISHFVWGSCSEWLKNNVLYFLMFQKSTIGYRGSRSVGVETSARDCLLDFKCPKMVYQLFLRGREIG